MDEATEEQAPVGTARPSTGRDPQPDAPSNPPSFTNRSSVDLGDYATTLGFVAERVWSAASGVLVSRAIPAPSIEIQIVDDPMSESETVRADLGLTPERRLGVERIGGIVAGKTLLDESADRGVVLLAAGMLSAPNTPGEFLNIFVMAHELMHAAYGATRRASGIEASESYDFVSDPWGAAGMVAITVAEEYRCDELAMIVADAAIHITDSVGNKVMIRDQVNDLHAEGVAQALDLLDPGLRTRVESYRRTGIGLGPMWGHVCQTINEFLILLAHAQATTAGAVADPTHPGTVLVAPIWEPLAAYLLSARPLPEVGDWGTDREKLRQIGLDGHIEMWRSLGLHGTVRNFVYLA